MNAIDESSGTSRRKIGYARTKENLKRERSPAMAGA
jgi:hypothetical protein